MRMVLGVENGSSPFNKAMSLCVESCALIVISGATTIGVAMSSDQVISMIAVIPAALQTHSCVSDTSIVIVNDNSCFLTGVDQVISPLLLIARVANGQAHSMTIPPVSHSIRFFHPPSTVRTDSSTPSTNALP